MEQQLRIGLSCIVKNESKVILTMLESVLPIIDYWCIVDTGSSDGTQRMIKDFFNEKKIPGELIEIEWKDFSTSRNVALEAIKGKVDWGFWIDADEIVEYSTYYSKQKLHELLKKYDGGFVQANYFNLSYNRLNFFNISKKNWYWNGPIHEYLDYKKLADNDNINIIKLNSDDISIRIGKHFGNSWTSQTNKEKYEKYVDILKKYIDENPNQDNSRWIFYLAQSYKDTGAVEYYEDVIKWYSERVKIPTGNPEERYISQLNISKFKVLLNKFSDDELLASFLACTDYNPDRIDHLEWVIEYYIRNKRWELAYIYSSYAITKNSPQLNFMFVNNIMYNWKAYDMHCMICFYSNRKEEMKKYGLILKERLDNNLVVDEKNINRVINNLKFYLS